MIVNLNGRFLEDNEARIAINDSGLLFGDTLFETLKADQKGIFFRSDHLDRLQLSAGFLDFPMDDTAINDALDRTVERLPWPLARLRLTLSRGAAAGLDPPAAKQGWFSVTAAEYREPTIEERERGVPCCLAPNRRVNPMSHLPQMKTGNYADCLYAARHARSTGNREAIFV
ncbi:MAG TPA: aminotransferase class IV, partial [Desulfuromonadales bacterium]|nr:aminotransferase class IV [Desulfuromonadales bacterium]